MILREATVRYAPGVRVPGPGHIRHARDVARICADLRDETQEHFCILHLDTKGRVVARQTVGIGTLTEVAIHPREAFRAAILAGAVSVILTHNHQSRDVEPSQADRVLTQRLRRVGQLVGIPVLDHVILGAREGDGSSVTGDYYSFQEQAEWPDLEDAME